MHKAPKAGYRTTSIGEILCKQKLIKSGGKNDQKKKKKITNLLGFEYT